MQECVMLIDDEPNVLSGLKRQLRKKHNIITANSGSDAIGILESSPPIAVVMCDMRMPGMDGIETLQSIKKKSPDTVRTMLTGNADQKSAIDAINKGQIFRFFSKPCEIEILEQGLADAIKQYRLVEAEKELLEQTLAGSVKILTDVLSLSDPKLFEHSSRVRNWVGKLKSKLKLENAWHLNLAVMLAPIGNVSVPKEILLKHLNGDLLTSQELHIVEQVPEISRDLISNIPRLEAVAEIVYYQDKNFDGSGFPDDDICGDKIPQVSRLLKITNDLAKITETATPTSTDFDFISRNASHYDPSLLSMVRRELMVEIETEANRRELVQIKVELIRPGDLLKDNIVTTDGQLLLARGLEISEAQVRKIRGLSKVGRVKGMTRVLRDPVSNDEEWWE